MADQKRNHVVIQIETMLAEAEPFLASECCIYRVPHEIRKFNEDAYTPKVVSIGPFQHGNPRLRNKESHKQVYCQKFIERAETSLDNLVSCVQELEPRFRHCHSENIKLGVDELLKVILVDCGFIFESFLRYFFDKRTDDVIQLKPWLTDTIDLDLLLLENQLPFLVLEKLYNLAFASSLKGDHPSFLQITLKFFEYYNIQKLVFDAISIIQHFTDLLRTFHLQPSDRRPSRTEDGITEIKSATELNEAGVKFKVKRNSNCLLDLKFSRRDLEIPEVKVEDRTEIVFRNMVAFEQFQYPNESYVIDFVILLDFLIDTNKDVDVLV